jgi:hypothetical protein
MIEPNRHISGTFRQKGKEYDGATLLQLTASEIPDRLRCDCGAELLHATLFPEGGVVPAELYKCDAEGCERRGIVYKPHVHTIMLEAVQDSE